MSDIGIIGLFHVVLIHIGAYSLLWFTVDIEIWFCVCDCYCWSILEWAHFGFGLLSILGLILDTHLPFVSHLNFSPLTPLHLYLSYRSLDWCFLLSYLFHHDTWLTIWIRGGYRSILEFLSLTFIHLLEFRFKIFHNGKALHIIDLSGMMLWLWQLTCCTLTLHTFCTYSFGHHHFCTPVDFVLST